MDPISATRAWCFRLLVGAGFSTVGFCQHGVAHRSTERLEWLLAISRPDVRSNCGWHAVALCWTGDHHSRDHATHAG